MPAPITPAKPAKKTKVRIVYAGRSKQFEFDPKELVGALLARAIAEFQIVQNQHLFALHDENGTELADDQTLREAGVDKREKLVLRQSVVRGG